MIGRDVSGDPNYKVVKGDDGGDQLLTPGGRLIPIIDAAGRKGGQKGDAAGTQLFLKASIEVAP
jgi:hypothetical protein